MSILSRKQKGVPVSENAVAMVSGLKYEVVPLRNLAEASSHLPVGCDVSVTCSPAKGIEETLAITEDLLSRGYQAVPHLSARLVRDRSHVAELGEWLSDHGVAEIFVVAGDAEEPVGSYRGAAEFLSDLMETNHGLSRVGVTGYPDGHALIADDVLDSAILEKQEILGAAGVKGHATTQMCFDVSQIELWLRRQRSAGLTMPVQLGLPGVVDRLKLLRMGARLGIGHSMRFLKKNGSAVGHLLTTSGYDPLELIEPSLGFAEELGVEGLHVFTFNSVAETAAWQAAVVGSRYE